MKSKRIFGLLVLSGLVVGMVCFISSKQMKKCKGEIKRWKDSSDKYYLYTNILSYWLKNKQMGKTIADYLLRQGIKRVAVYGMGFAGERLLDELKDSSVEVVCGIDQNADTIWADVEVYSLNEKLPEVDAVIVTAIHYFDSIERNLKAKTSSRILSLEDILCGM